MAEDISNNKIIKYFGPKYRIYQHLLFWIIYFADTSGILFYDKLNLPLTMSVFFIDMAMMYFNLYFLLPRFMLKNKFVPYLFFTILTLIIDISLSEFIDFYFFRFPGEYHSYTLKGFILNNLLNFQLTTFFLGTAVGLKMFKIWIADQQKIRQLENINLNTELNYLKSQINPHFLFNTLNNIYVLSRIDKDNVPTMILQLSDLLRYQLYECSKDKVLLTLEIEYLRNYIELERIRKTNAVVKFEIKGSPEGKLISPFIFIPFIENAVKHGFNSSVSESIVDIVFDIDSHSIHFCIENSYNPNAERRLEGGLGLNNIMRRLELIYPKNFNLHIQENGKIFYVDLMLDNVF